METVSPIALMEILTCTVAESSRELTSSFRKENPRCSSARVFLGIFRARYSEDDKAEVQVSGNRTQSRRGHRSRIREAADEYREGRRSSSLAIHI